MSLKPYYDEDGITIFHADCRELLHTFNVAAVVTDPPYGVLANGSAAVRRSLGNDSDGQVAWDIAPDIGVMTQVIACAPVQMIWGGLHLPLPVTYGYLVWDKQIDGLNFGECEVCWTSMRFAPRIFRYRAVGVDGGKQHPTQKPVDLMKWCLGFAPDGMVLDPFMGSGTTLRAAKDLGRRAVGVEIEERYCEIAANRLRQRVLPLEMADGR